ncbi:MAG: pre-peptidase, partial [Calothrix sp. SM1_7_51]|nr:pre-peptidase [Calothrix sp. SM1_7_51]
MSGKLAIAQANMYSPFPLAINKELTDTLSQQDIPTGQGGFYRDYIVSLKQGEQIAIEVKSKSFDTIVSLIARGGTTIGE